jgi:hypothetical protein
MATRGTIVSGKAVPTAAKTLPTAPSDRFNSSPRCSTALVNTTQTNTISAKITNIQKKEKQISKKQSPN